MGAVNLSPPEGRKDRHCLTWASGWTGPVTGFKDGSKRLTVRTAPPSGRAHAVPVVAADL